MTGSQQKLKETQDILALVAPDITLVGNAVDLVEVQGATVAEVARAKAQAAAVLINGPVLTEDFGLCFRALGDLPGPYIKWFIKKLGANGLHKLLADFEDKTAYTVSVFAYCEGPGEEPLLFEGRCLGQIVAPRGQAKFGPEPIFLPDGYDVTFGEMSEAAKNAMSHRFHALAHLQNHFETLSPARVEATTPSAAAADASVGASAPISLSK